MFLVESKLRNLIRSVIVESLLKEEEKVDTTFDNFKSVLKECSEKYSKVWNDQIVKKELAIVQKLDKLNDVYAQKNAFKKNYPVEIMLENIFSNIGRDQFNIVIKLADEKNVPAIAKLLKKILVERLAKQTKQKNPDTTDNSGKMSDHETVLKKIDDLYKDEKNPVIKQKLSDLSSKLSAEMEDGGNELLSKISNELKDYDNFKSEILDKIK